MTTDRQMANAYAAQEEVVAALRSINEPDLAVRLEDCTTDNPFGAAQRKWLAAHLPICRVCLVPATDDPRMAEWHVPMVGRSN